MHHAGRRENSNHLAYVPTYHAIGVRRRYAGTPGLKHKTMTYAYIRYSTDTQNDTQQMHALSEYASQHSLTIDEFERDEGVSGGVSFRNRNLNRLVKKLHQGDVLIVSEISRLGRSISDINILVNEELKKRGVRLIITKMGIDLNCASMKAADQMLIFAFGFAAEVEKEMIVQRTQSAIDARKEAIRTQGGFMSKSGNWTKKLGNKKGVDMSPARQSSILVRHGKAQSWRDSSALYHLVERCVFKRMPRKEILELTRQKFEEEPDVYCTRMGKPLCEGTLSTWIKEIELR